MLARGLHQRTDSLRRSLLKCETIRRFQLESTSATTKSADVRSNLKNENPIPKETFRKMKGWQLHSYNDVANLQLSHNIRKPSIRKPTEVLVKVEATSVNPLDTAMIRGYGSKVLNLMRCNPDVEFPLILGRDFSGTVINKGQDVTDKEMKIGDKVWGVVPVQDQGCHAEFVKVDSYCLSKKPHTLDNIESGGILYAGLTAWSGLFISGQLGEIGGMVSSTPGNSGKNKRVLVLGASGGVGTMAIQIALAEGSEVIATCANSAIPMIQSLGVDLVVDYGDTNSNRDLVHLGPYDIILDCAGRGTEYATTLPWKYNHYVTFSSPTLKNIDEYGFIGGMFKNATSLAENNIKSISTQQGLVKWGYFIPASVGIKYLRKLAEKGKLKPIIQEVYNFDRASDAYQKVLNGHLRGKILLNMT